MAINTYSVFGTAGVKSGKLIDFVADTAEYLRNGDIVVVTEYRFYIKRTGTDAGWCRVTDDGQHRHIAGDAGSELLRKFNMLPA